MGLFGLLGSLFGLGYMQHKSVQNINNMRANAERLYGNHEIANWEHKEYADKNLKKVLEFYNERFNYYLQNPESIPTEKYPEEARKALTGDAAEYALRAVAGYYAAKDMNSKWAPNYEALHEDYNNPNYRCMLNLVLLHVVVGKIFQMLLVQMHELKFII